MKTITSLIILVIFTIVAAAFALAYSTSVRSASIKIAQAPSYDTIKFYAVSTYSETKNGRTKYQVDGRPASKKKYDKYANNFEEFKNCKPCYMRTYSKDGTLLSEGDQYTDCAVGKWKEYYSSGKVKVEGQCKTDSTGLWDENSSGNWCGIREGKWTYYGKNGSIDSVVNYVNNVRVK